jgi:GT2 family glycosyltransferase
MTGTVGTVCGKLLSINSDLKLPADPVIDSAGIYFTPSMRHFDRGWHEPDDSRYDRMEYVFGASAAAALYRREMIEDVSNGDGFFDPDFFAYREDADVAWRAQLLGWTCIYTHLAVGHHVRRVSPFNRRSVPAVLNMHSVKNRFLMRIKNTTSGVFARCWLPMILRDLQVIGGCLLIEPTSLPAFWKVIACFRRTLDRRRDLLGRRRVDDDTIARWFQHTPVAEPAAYFQPSIKEMSARASS